MVDGPLGFNMIFVANGIWSNLKMEYGIWWMEYGGWNMVDGIWWIE